MDISAISPDMIPMLSMNMASARVANEVGIAVLDKTMDITEQGAAGLINMMRSTMELSVNPNVGSHFDVSV